MHLLVPAYIRRQVKGQPVHPSNERDTLRGQSLLLHPCDEVVHVLVHDRLHGPHGPAAECGGELARDLPVPDGVFFPDDATKVCPTVLKVCLDKDL